ncbi:efflux RND transporter periplasmic adaptor subunit [Butyricicoccus sp. Marseille-Q5471]|uniref:efflux RND transporter periplasmic adaptor subunit n=1 Tax=Butyricicoccus sp. Marseille-Q5471 TaxID=3039493 RepID=UPI0024BC619D|nr:efflux RND transporter periplasmic adaptor subunit [Butyricicoccus sp. Marseille-Q5471]
MKLRQNNKLFDRALALPDAKTKLRRFAPRIIAGVLVLCITGGAAVHLLRKPAAGASDLTPSAPVERRDIIRELTGVGTLAPINQYNVTPLVSGNVLESSFEEGDKVKKGQMLYRIDPAEAQKGIEDAKIALSQSQMSYRQQTDGLSSLIVKALRGGMVTALHVGVGDRIEAGAKVASMRDSATMLLTVPFNAADADRFSVGQMAQVTVAGSFETVSGKIKSIDAAVTVGNGFQMVKNVTISVINPGALSPSASASAVIGGVASSGSAAFRYNDESEITAQVSGTVVSISAKQGGLLKAGETILTLSSESLNSQSQSAALAVRSAELTLENANKTLQNYNIVSPIEGTVVTKNIKAGDTLGQQGTQSSNSNAMAVIYDLSSLVFNLPLNELDINVVKVGQKVQVKVDALDGRTFAGVIIRRSVAGNTDKGTTSYPVTVRVDNPPEELLPGMNVSARIEVARADQVLAVPVTAVQYGDVVYVKDGPGYKPDADAQPDPAQPAGYHAVKVTAGVTDGTYIEIKDGLSEGDEVYAPAAEPSVPADGGFSDMGGENFMV